VSAHLIRFGATCSVLAGLAACVSSPAPRSPQDEQALAQEQAKFIEFTLGLERDPRIAGYVEEVGQRLAAHAMRKDVDYEFYIVDMASANAFSLPDGHVYISRGLLALINSEEELAGVLGHEMGHVEAHHPVMRRPTEAASAVQSAGSVAGIAASLLAQAAGAGSDERDVAARRALLAPYSREQEREADRIGQ